MLKKLQDLFNLFFGRSIMPGWIELVNPRGTKMIARNMTMKDGSVKCIGLCSSHANIYAGPYEKGREFLHKPQHVLIIVNEESLQLHMGREEMEEVLEAYRRLCLIA